MELLRRMVADGNDISLVESVIFRLRRRDSIYIPHGITIIETNVCAQYTCPTGAVAIKMPPTVNANIAHNMTKLAGTRLMIKPVVKAAQSPLRATGTN
jgi:hypothetical protein